MSSDPAAVRGRSKKTHSEMQRWREREGSGQGRSTQGVAHDSQLIKFLHLPDPGQLSSPVS